MELVSNRTHSHTNRLKMLLEGEEIIKFKETVCATLQNDPIFARNYDRLETNENRRINHERWKRLVEYRFVKDPLLEMDKFSALSDVLEVYDTGLSARMSLHTSIFTYCLMSMGTERHAKLIEKARNNKIVGCFCMTELGHGSNVQGLQTEFRYREDDGCFVVNSPSDDAVKVWAGNLAHSATHAIVFGKLIVKQKNEGIHALTLQIRDQNTMKPLPGIRIGDMGEKPGAWNGVENGWMEFKSHRAPLSSLLNRGCDITHDGVYTSRHTSSAERQSVSLGTMSAGRISIIGKSALACALASTIAIRYSSVRKQFGREGTTEELPILQYPIHQHRLLPFLAAHFVFKIFYKRFVEHFQEYMMRVMSGEKSTGLSMFSREIHALSSAAKAVTTWTGADALVEARRACGGFGFLNSARLMEFRDNFEPSTTFEGENNILLQQASNVILSLDTSTTHESAMNTMEFVGRPQEVFRGFSGDLVNDIVFAYDWLLSYLLKEAKDEFNLYTDSFDGRNNSQVYRAHPLSVAYAERSIIKWSHEFIENIEDLSIREILGTACRLYAAHAIEKHLSSLYMGGYCSGSLFGVTIRCAVVAAERQLLPNAVALVESIAPPDFLLHSTLGMADGNYSAHLMEDFRSRTSQPGWTADLGEFLRSRECNSKI